MRHPGNRRRLEWRDAVSGSLQRPTRHALNAHHGHREQLEAHVPCGLRHHLIPDTHQSDKRLGDRYADYHHEYGVDDGQRERLEQYVVGVGDLSSADSARDHRAHSSVQTHPGGYEHHQERLGQAESGNRLEPDAACPDQVCDVIDDAEKALGDLRPREVPEVAGDAPLGKVSARVAPASPEALARASSARRVCFARLGLSAGFWHGVTVSE